MVSMCRSPCKLAPPYRPSQFPPSWHNTSFAPTTVSLETVVKRRIHAHLIFPFWLAETSQVGRGQKRGPLPLLPLYDRAKCTPKLLMAAPRCGSFLVPEFYRQLCWGVMSLVVNTHPSKRAFFATQYAHFAITCIFGQFISLTSLIYK